MIEPYHARVFRNEQKHKTAQMNDYKTKQLTYEMIYIYIYK